MRSLDSHTNVSGTVNANWVALCRGELCANFGKVSYRRESTPATSISLMPTRTIINGLDEEGRCVSCRDTVVSIIAYFIRSTMPSLRWIRDD